MWPASIVCCSSVSMYHSDITNKLANAVYLLISTKYISSIGRMEAVSCKCRVMCMLISVQRILVVKINDCAYIFLPCVISWILTWRKCFQPCIKNRTGIFNFEEKCLKFCKNILLSVRRRLREIPARKKLCSLVLVSELLGIRYRIRTKFSCRDFGNSCNLFQL